MAALGLVGELGGCGGDAATGLVGGGEGSATTRYGPDCEEVFAPVLIQDASLTVDWSAMRPLPRTLVVDVIGGDPEVVGQQICGESSQATQLVAARAVSPEESPCTSMAADLSEFG